MRERQPECAQQLVDLAHQAFYDGFNGSPQKTIGQQAGGGLSLSLNEMGLQTEATGQPGYFGSEVSANAAGGMIGDTASEAYQASYYQQALDLLACDPNVRVINIFHLVDEPKALAEAKAKAKAEAKAKALAKAKANAKAKVNANAKLRAKHRPAAHT